MNLAQQLNDILRFDYLKNHKVTLTDETGKIIGRFLAKDMPKHLNIYLMKKVLESYIIDIFKQIQIKIKIV